MAGAMIRLPMPDLPKFLFCDDGDEGEGRLFVAHIRAPRFLMEFVDHHSTEPVPLEFSTTFDPALLAEAIRFYESQMQGHLK
jgi:hypothetical protein